VFLSVDGRVFICGRCKPPLPPPYLGERFFRLIFVNGVVDRLNRRIFSYFSVFFRIFRLGGVCWIPWGGLVMWGFV
jgi:hypothetical protein